MIKYDIDALDYIAKIADGGMRDAITMLDKCLSYSTDLTLQNVTDALGITDFATMFELTASIYKCDNMNVIEMIENIHRRGNDLKQFMKQYTNFVLDICKYDIMQSLEFTTIPSHFETELKNNDVNYFDTARDLLDTLIKLNMQIKWETSPKAMIESTLIIFNKENRE